LESQAPEKLFEMRKGLLTGAHVIVGSQDAEADRAFFRDALGLDSVDLGGGWLIFALPPAELAVHPGKGGRHELYMMCSDLDAALQALKTRGVRVGRKVYDEPWGKLATFKLPGGAKMSIYEPRHASPGRRSGPRR
jgi:catechol 2,3-dioxygenase-like lactoylglutathione lyase family enzyme